MASPADRIRSQLLVLRYRRGEDEALEELVAIWERPLFYYIRRFARTEDDAWDVLQETWLRVVRKIGQLRDPDKLATWLYRIARNTALTHLRDNPMLYALPDDESNLPTATADETFSAADAQAIHWGLGQLPLAQREVLTLRFLEGFSISEISSVTGVSAGTVKSRLHYGKQALREIMTAEGLGRG